METGKDQYIQQMLEQKIPIDNHDKDAMVYQQLFDLLQKENGHGFTMSFTANITRAIIEKQDKKFMYLSIGLLALALLIGIPFISLFLKGAFFKMIGSLLLSYKWIVLFVLVLILIMQWQPRGRKEYEQRAEL
jgi:ethanolamine transporter EutH